MKARIAALTICVTLLLAALLMTVAATGCEEQAPPAQPPTRQPAPPAEEEFPGGLDEDVDQPEEGGMELPEEGDELPW